MKTVEKSSHRAHPAARAPAAKAITLGEMKTMKVSAQSTIKSLALITTTVSKMNLLMDVDRANWFFLRAKCVTKPCPGLRFKTWMTSITWRIADWKVAPDTTSVKVNFWVTSLSKDSFSQSIALSSLLDLAGATYRTRRLFSSALLAQVSNHQSARINRCAFTRTQGSRPT